MKDSGTNSPNLIRSAHTKLILYVKSLELENCIDIGAMINGLMAIKILIFSHVKKALLLVRENAIDDI